MVRGFTTFQDFVESGEGIATNILAVRLKKLQGCGIVSAEKDEEDGRRVIYRLTQKGIDLAPVMLELLIWGAQHEDTGAPPAVIAELAKNRKAVLDETRRRWHDRDPSPLLPWLGGPKRKGRKPIAGRDDWAEIGSCIDEKVVDDECRWSGLDIRVNGFFGTVATTRFRSSNCQVKKGEWDERNEGDAVSVVQWAV